MTARFTHDGAGTSAQSWRDRPEWSDVPDWSPEEGIDRVVVAAAHPDDESLGAGGLITRLRRAGVPVHLVLATAGEHSHPRSRTTTPQQLARRRREEAHAAWSALAGDPAAITVAELPDGGLADHEAELTRLLVDIVGDGRATLLLTPYVLDGHPDHDALGRSGQRAAFRTGARLVHYPVWLWHHTDPADAPWGRLRRVALTPADREAKARAVASHVSQVEPLSPEPGDERLLAPQLLEHFRGDVEAYVDGRPADPAFDELHTEYDDPWGTTTRWYEARKRELLLAMLPRRRFTSGLDLGCSTGTLTGALAGRCDRLVAVDGSERAVATARARLHDHEHVEVRRADLGRDWPAGRFDLVVMSESGYFLSPPALDAVVASVAATLTPDGCLVLAHWRHPIDGWPLSGPLVQQRFRDSDAIPPLAATYLDRDVEIVVHAAASTLPGPAT